jgi:FixJ family two-component response regulator
MTLAIVDDDQSVRKALARLLQSLGHEVHVFASGEDFEAQNPAIDCAIVDVRMPGLSGIELRDRLRNRPVPVPVVLISGDADQKFQGELRPDDTPTVAKPFDDVTLTAAIAEAISAAGPRPGPDAF